MRKHILVVDDEGHIRRMTRLTLETAGYAVREASDGVQCLEAFDDGTEWDAVLLDQKMPRLDGLGTLQRIKERSPRARVIMVTAFASIELAVEAMKFGASDFVRKPMTPEVIRNAVAAALSKGTGGYVADLTLAASSREAAPVSAVKSQPLIQTITMNGFTILDDEDAPRLEPHERRFTVISPDGNQHEILVSVGDDAVGYVERMTGRRLTPASSFWTSRAKRFLSDYLWNEGKVPPTRSLTVRDISRDGLTVAARWGVG